MNVTPTVNNDYTTGVGDGYVEVARLIQETMLLMMAIGQSVDTNLFCHLNDQLRQAGSSMRSLAQLGTAPGLMGYQTPYDDLLSDTISRYEEWKKMHGEGIPNPFLLHE